MIKKVHHIGIAVKDLDKAVYFCGKVLKLEVSDYIDTPDMIVAMVTIGDVKVELMQPKEASAGAIAKFVEKRGEGVQHICLEVDDIEKGIKHVKDMGYGFVDENVRKGLEGDIVFLKPKETFGVLFELLQS